MVAAMEAVGAGQALKWSEAPLQDTPTALVIQARLLRIRGLSRTAPATPSRALLTR
jgi:hypothetical protein